MNDRKNEYQAKSSAQATLRGAVYMVKVIFNQMESIDAGRTHWKQLSWHIFECTNANVLVV